MPHSAQVNHVNDRFDIEIGHQRRFCRIRAPIERQRKPALSVVAHSISVAGQLWEWHKSSFDD